jgi:ABC-2 type transport system permease protein
MLQAIWGKTLRDHRVPILGWGILLGFFLYVLFAVYGTQVKDAAARASLAQLAQTFRFFGDPIAVATPEGYVSWRFVDAFAPIILSIWTLLVGARMVRGEEERGSMDMLLATPCSRVRVLLEKLFALVIALLIISLLAGLGAIIGEATTPNLQLHAGRALLAGLNMGLAAFFFATVALFLSQILPSVGAAAGTTGVLLAASFVIDGTGRTIENGVWLQRFSPLYYYDINKPLIPSAAAHYSAPVVLFAASLLLILASTVLFSLRDTSGVAWPAIRRPRTIAQRKVLARAWRSLSTRTVSLRTLTAQRTPTFWWLVALIAWAAWGTSLIPSVLKPLSAVIAGSPAAAQIVGGHNATTNVGLLSFIVFQFVSIIAVVFVFTLALHWPTNLERSRLDLVLSTPHTRIRVLLGHFSAVLIAAILAPLLVWLAVVLAAQASNISINAGNVAAASLSLIGPELVIATAVYALALRLSSGVIIGLACTYLACAFLADFLQALLKLPDWVISLSIFHAYGTPAVNGWQWQPLITMIAVAAVLLVIGMVQFRYNDVK